MQARDSNLDLPQRYNQTRRKNPPRPSAAYHFVRWGHLRSRRHACPWSRPERRCGIQHRCWRHICNRQERKRQPFLPDRYLRPPNPALGIGCDNASVWTQQKQHEINKLRHQLQAADAHARLTIRPAAQRMDTLRFTNFHRLIRRINFYIYVL